VQLKNRDLESSLKKKHIRNTVIRRLEEDCVLVPAVDQTPTGQSLADGDSLLLTTGNTANPGISDEGLPHMTKTEDGGEDFGDLFDELVPSLTIRSRMRGTSLGRESDRFLDGQGGEVNVVFGGILNVTAIVSGNVFWSERVVMDVTPDVVVSIALVREHLEERCASGSRATQDD